MAQLIAELCQNHNGDEKIVEEMVHAAAESGADYAKIQSIDSNELTYRERFENGLIEGGKVKVIKRPYQSEYDRLKKLDLTEEFQLNFHKICEKYQKNIEFKLICLNPHTQKIEFSNIHEYKEKNIIIFIGPEGGYSDEEIKLFEKCNIEKININKYILRTETASIVGAFLAQILCNN